MAGISKNNSTGRKTQAVKGKCADCDATDGLTPVMRVSVTGRKKMVKLCAQHQMKA